MKSRSHNKLLSLWVATTNYTTKTTAVFLWQSTCGKHSIKL